MWSDVCVEKWKSVEKVWVDDNVIWHKYNFINVFFDTAYDFFDRIVSRGYSQNGCGMWKNICSEWNCDIVFYIDVEKSFVYWGQVFFVFFVFFWWLLIKENVEKMVYDICGFVYWIGLHFGENMLFRTSFFYDYVLRSI